MNRMYYNEYFGKFNECYEDSFLGIRLSEDDPSRFIKKVLSNLDYSLLLEQYSEKGRKGYNPIMLFTILVYSKAMGPYSADKIIEKCQKDISYIFLTEGKVPSRSVFYDFINHKLTKEIETDLHYQIIHYLHEKSQLSLSKLFIDGTKIEANSNRYQFVWRGSINYHLLNLSEKINKLYEEYNNFITDSAYATVYELTPLEPFVIEKLEKVKEIVEINRERKKKNQEKRQNNVIIEIKEKDIDILRKVGNKLEKLAVKEGIHFVHGKGKKNLIFSDYQNCLSTITIS